MLGAGLLMATGGGYDADAQTYIAAVETADGQALESGVKDAINAFVVGCKADGIWNAIKASCILAGARTLSGCLIPLVGTAPTNVNFVTADYNRKTGLVGNGSTKYLNSNRAANADPQDNMHIAVYKTGGVSNGCMIGSLAALSRTYTHNFIDFSSDTRFSNRGVLVAAGIVNTTTGLFGTSRSASNNFTRIAQQNVVTVSGASNAAGANNYLIFNRPVSNYFDSSRFAYYSIGTSLDLTTLDTRVTTLINAIAAAIP